MSMSRWYVVHCQPNGEQQALFHLRRQGYEAYLPLYQKTRRHARRIEQVRRALFPRYLFVKLDLEVNPWRPIRSSVGVSHLICQGEHPSAVPQGIVEDLQARENENGTINPNRSFQQGDRVEIKSGALCDHVGLFDVTDGDQRVVILLGLLGREVRVRVPVGDIQACA